MAREFSFPTLTDNDLKGKPFRLNELLKWLAEHVSNLSGANGPFAFLAGPFRFRGQVTFESAVNAVDPVTVQRLLVYADNATAMAAGLGFGRLYRTATGTVMVVYEP